MNYIVKTHKKDTIYNKPHFFVLNKGMNSGKPQNEQFTNSFVVIFDSEAESENIFWIAYSLWKSKFWHQHLVGSVIPFLRLNDFKKDFFIKSKIIMKEHDAHIKHVAALKLLEKREKQFYENINLINDMRRVVLMRYINRK